MKATTFTAVKEVNMRFTLSHPKRFFNYPQVFKAAKGGLLLRFLQNTGDHDTLCYLLILSSPMELNGKT